MLNLICSAQSPFTSKPDKITKTPAHPTFIRKIINATAPLQRDLKKTISDLTGDLKDSYSPGLFLLIFLFSFFYGAVHALGPGHGKIIVFSYFSSVSEPDIKAGLTAGTAISFLQAASAVLLVTVMHYILDRTFFFSYEETRTIISRISYGMIFFLGIYLFINSVVEMKRKINPENKNNKLNGPLLSAVLSVGIIPCAGTIIILLFTLASGILWLGILMTFFIALGMSVTISLAGIAAISTKKGVFVLFSKNSKYI